MDGSRPESHGVGIADRPWPRPVAAPDVWLVNESRASAILRRTLDISVSGPLLIVLSPLLLALVVAVRLDSPGPAIFRQRRLGRRLRPLTVHKFRSMSQGADEGRHRAYVRDLITGAGNGDSHGGGDSQGLYKLVVDDRVTRFGHLLRRSSLDELPQLWDVFRGAMSLVGPRPVIPYELEHYPDWYLERFAVKPGLTGLWQVSGRNERTYEEMVRLDVEYVRSRTLWLDIKILVRTAGTVFGRRGAA